MFEDFRQQAKDSNFEEPEEMEPAAYFAPAPRSSRFLGMTPPQRFFIALLLLMMAVVLSTLCLLVTERIVPPL